MADTVLAVLDAGAPRLADPTAPLVRGDDLGVVRGEGVFETLRIRNAQPFLLAEHLSRMRRSAAAVDVLLPPAAQLRALALAAATAYGDDNGSLRLVATKGPGGGAPGVTYAVAAPVPAEVVRQREQGVHAVALSLGVLSDARAAAPWLLGGVKATSYAVNMAALRAAAERGADDVVFVSADGEVLEGPTSTVVWVRDGQLHSVPAAEVGTLAGTTLLALTRLARVTVRRPAVAELRDADEAMLVSSVRGVAPLLSLDRRPIGDGRAGAVTQRLRDQIETAVTAGGLE